MCDLPRAQVTAEKLGGFQKCVWGFYLTELTFGREIVTHSVWGVVCDLLRARATAEKDSEVLKCVCEDFASLNWHLAENRNFVRIRSSVWFTTRTSNCRDRLGGFQ